MSSVVGEGSEMEVEPQATTLDDSGKVISVVFFHRHGDRSPATIMPSDSRNNAKWFDGPGMLSPRGMRQMETLGRKFRRRYLLGKPYRVLPSSNYHQGSYKVRSTDVDRTIQSALSFIKGFFPDGTGPTGGLSNVTQVVPVRTMPSALDSVLLAFEEYVCPRIIEIHSKVRQSDLWKEMEKEQAEFLKRLAQLSGYSKLSLEEIGKIADPLNCDKAHNYTWPDGFTEQDFDKAVKLLNWKYEQFIDSSNELRRLVGGNMIAQVIARFQRANNSTVTVPEIPTGDFPYLYDGTMQNDVRISHFSAHDTTLISLLSGLGLYDNRVPKYGSSIVFELVEKDETVFVRTFYNYGVQNVFTQTLDICGQKGKPLCELDTFVQFYSHTVIKDYAHACKKKGVSAHSTDMKTVFLIILVLLGCMLFLSKIVSRPSRHDAVDDELVNLKPGIQNL